MQVVREYQKPSNEARNTLLGTSNFLRVQAACEDAANGKKVVCLIGDPGLGKTTGLSYYSKANQNVTLTTARSSMAAKHFWIHVCESIQGTAYRTDLYKQRSLHFVINMIIKKLRSLGESLLIIDECGKLTDKMLEHIHEIRDQTDDTTGIVLAGPHYFKSNLAKWVELGKVGMPEFSRRINYYEELQRPDKSEIRSFCEHFDIIDPMLIKQLAQESKDFGTLRNLISEYAKGMKTR